MRSDSASRGHGSFMIPKASTFMTAVDGSSALNLVYPYQGHAAQFYFSGLPIAGQTITVGGEIYIWRAVPGTEENAVFIGVDGDACAENLRRALIDGSAAHSDKTGSGTLYGSDTVVNPDILHAEIGTDADRVWVTASTPIVVSETSANATVAEFDSGNPNQSGFMKYVREGGFTEIKAHSRFASGNIAGVTVTGFTNTADATVFLYAHDGSSLGVLRCSHDKGGPVYLSSPSGIAGILNTGVENVVIHFRAS